MERTFDYSAGGVPVRDDLVTAHRFLWEHLRLPGTWWTGAERVAIAAESRAARDCQLCRDRKAALSPTAVTGSHDHLGTLPPPVVDVIHRIRTDSGRLSRPWFEQVTAGDLAVTHYVELVGALTLVAGVDYFAHALGIPPLPLPEPLPGAPSRHLPATAQGGRAWVSMIAPRDADGPEAQLYGDARFVPNIFRALSLVPDQVRALHRSMDAHYMTPQEISDPAARGRALGRVQMELIAARVSAINECFY
jgi:hypothetical protein